MLRIENSKSMCMDLKNAVNLLAVTLLAVSVWSARAEADSHFPEVKYLEFGGVRPDALSLLQQKAQQANGVDFDTNLIGFMNADSIRDSLLHTIAVVCPECRTTSTGSTVRVSFGSSSTREKDVRKIEEDDDSRAEDVAQLCEELVDDYGNDDKDVHILDAAGDDTLVICFDDD